MRAYLLGLLPDEEASAMEEEYFVNRAFFLKVRSAEEALIGEYCDGTLPAHEAQCFEERYLQIPDHRRRVEEVRRQRTSAARAPRAWFSTGWRLAAAAVCLLVLGGGTWVYLDRLPKHSRSASQVKSPDGTAVTPVRQPDENLGSQAQPLPRPSVSHAQPPQRRFTSKVKTSQKVRTSQLPSLVPHELAHSLAADGPVQSVSQPGESSKLPETQPSVETAISPVASPAVLAPANVGQAKKRVAVLDFDYGTVRSSVAAILGSDQDIGKGIADILVQKLVQDGKYRVIERKALNTIVAEQSFSSSDRADPSTAARIGKVLGVDAIITGSVTKFGRDDKTGGGSGGGYGLGRFGLGGVQKRDAKAVCVITVRMVDTRTAEILAAITVSGASKRGGVSLVGAGGGSNGGGGAFDMSSKNFSETILGEAVSAAVNSAGDQLDQEADSLPTTKAVVSGLVADVSGNTLILNVGRNAGLQVGDKLEITRAVRTVKDPATGNVIQTVTDKIGTATLTDVDADSSTAMFTGSGPAKIGDVANAPK